MTSQTPHDRETSSYEIAVENSALFSTHMRRPAVGYRNRRQK
jgi:hypothetical protein